MSKVSLFTQIKLFVSSHLVPVIATSAVVVVGATAGIIAIVANSQSKDTEVAVNTPVESPKEEEQTKPSDESNKEEQDQEPTSEEKPSTSSTSNTSKPAESTKPTTSQNQTSNNTNITTQKPSTSSSQPTAPSKPSTNQTQPSQPTTPATPTQPTTPVEPEKPTVKTDYYYLCVGTTNDPAIKAEILSWGGNIEQDFMVYSLERKSAITNCLDEIRKMNAPDIAYKLNWKLYEFDTFDELMRFENNLFYGSN